MHRKKKNRSECNFIWLKIINYVINVKNVKKCALRQKMNQLKIIQACIN